MIVRVGLENNIEGRSLAWALDYPGCFAYGKESSEAILRFPQALVSHQSWVASHTDDSWLADLDDFDIRLADVFECYSINRDTYEPDPEGIEINAWFRDDWKPLNVIETKRGALLLTWAREELQELIASLDGNLMDRKFTGERWTVRGILGHIANAEFWYMDRLNLAGCKRSELPEDVFDRLQVTRSRMLQILPELAGDRIVVGVQGEFWSPRKVLRRAIWHELDHLQHIHRLSITK